MADNFGLKIGLEGEKEFKKALSEINQSFKVLGSEMKLATSQFDKNDKSVQALTARSTVLNKEIEAQKQKIETLRSALKNAAEGMAEDINGVMGDLAHDMQTALPTNFDVSGSFRSAVDGVTGKAASAFTIALNITNFNNYSSEDIRQLTNEVMETANQFAQRKGVVFA